MIWGIVQHFLNDNMRKLIVFCSVNDYLDVLSEYMNINHLPPCIYEHGRGEGGPGMPKRLDAGRVPPPNQRDHDLATKDDIDPGYTASLSAALLAKERPSGVAAKGTSLGGGVFDFASIGDDPETVVTLAGHPPEIK